MPADGSACFTVELQRVEQEIKDLEDRITATMAEDDVDIIQQRIDRLVQEKREMRQELINLHAQLASPAGEVLSVAPQ